MKRLWWTAAMLSLAWMGCVETPASSEGDDLASQGQPCVSSADCGGALRCLTTLGGGACVMPCSSVGDCFLGEECRPVGGSNTGYCALPEDDPVPQDPRPDDPIEDPPNDQPDPNDPPDNPDPTPEPRPNLPMGANDGAASMGCAMFEGEPSRVLAVSNQGDAGQTVILPSDAQSYMVELPEGEGFLTVEIPEWRAEVAFFAHFSTAFNVLEAQPLGGRRWNGACGEDKGLTDTRFKFHSWGAFTVQYGADGPRQAWFAAIHLNP